MDELQTAILKQWPKLRPPPAFESDKERNPARHCYYSSEQQRMRTIGSSSRRLMAFSNNIVRTSGRAREPSHLRLQNFSLRSKNKMGAVRRITWGDLRPHHRSNPTTAGENHQDQACITTHQRDTRKLAKSRSVVCLCNMFVAAPKVVRPVQIANTKRTG